MNKLTLWVMAALCLSLTACHEQELSSEIIDDELELRSLDKLILTYTTTTGVAMSIECNEVQCHYDNQLWLAIVISSSSGTITRLGNDISISVEEGCGISFSDSDGVALTSDSVRVYRCDEELCYETSGPVNTGAGMGFIIDDDCQGF